MKKIEEHTKAPEFKILNQDGIAISLSQFLGKKVVLFFYPKASTPGCTAEACNLSDNHKAFQDQGYVVLGISPDTPEKQKKFKDKYGFPYDLLADIDHKIAEAYGVWGPKKFMGREYDGIHRTTFIIDDKGIVAQRIDKVDTKNHTSQIL